MIDGGERFYSAVFAPGSPDGGITIVSPLDGANGVSSTPRIVVVNSCTNCDGLFLDILSSASFEVDASVDFFSMPFPTTIDFSDLDPNEGTLGPIAELPPGEYDVEVDTFVEDFTLASFVPTDDFEYFAGVFREDNVSFTVPEPGAPTAQLLASLTLLGLLRARRGSRSSRVS